MVRTILHLDMDAFFASVEQAINPFYRGKPLIVGSRGKKERTVVAACSYEAKAFGISSGMPTAQAFRLCPEALFVAADSSRYVHTSDRISEILQEYSALMERPSIDEFYLDLGGVDTVQAAAIGRRIKEKIFSQFSITGSVGIAPSKIVAKIAAKARKPDGLLVIAEDEVSGFLGPLPVEKVPGIGPHLTEHLHLLSIATCADLANADPGLLISRFGKTGLWLSEVCRGIDDEEVPCWQDPDPLPKSVSHSYTLEHNLYRRQELSAWMRMLCEMVAYRLRRQELAAYGCGLYIKERSGFLARERRFHSSTQDTAEIFRRAMALFDSFGLRSFTIRGLGVSASGLAAPDHLWLFHADVRRAQLLAAQDAINERFGEWSLYPAAIQDVK